MAHEAFTWVQFIPGVQQNPDRIAVATAAVCACLLSIFSLFAYRALKKSTSHSPEGEFSLKAVAESLLEFVIGLADMVIGKEGRKFVPAFGAVFLIILFNNLIGVVPGMSPPTDNFNLTFAIGLCSFFFYTILGIKEHGFSYAKHFTGHLPFKGAMIVMALFLIPIEFVSHIFRPMTLGLRLMGNMQGDHTVVGVFTDLFPIGLPIPFYLLGIFVCFMQAFVFTLLSMVYVSFAIAHEEHH